MQSLVSIIVPVYNEKISIAETVRGIHNTLSAAGGSFEIIVVDDGSDDGSARVLDAVKGIARILRHQQNRGYGASIKSGIAASVGDLIAIIDADGTYRYDRLPELVRAMAAHDMVVAARTGAEVCIPFSRRLAKWFITRLAEYLCGQPISDLNSGMRVMRRDVMKRFQGLLPDGFSFTTTITLAMITNGYRVHFVPVNYRVRRGRSKFRPIRDTLTFIQLIIRTVMYFEPLKVFLPISLMLFAAALAALIHRVLVGKGLLVISVMLFVAAVQVLAIGMLADLIDKRGQMNHLPPDDPRGP